MKRLVRNLIDILLVGTFFTSVSLATVYSYPSVEAKIKNVIDSRPLYQREDSQFLKIIRSLDAKPQPNFIRYKQLTDPQGMTSRLSDLLKTKMYNDILEERVRDLPDIEEKSTFQRYITKLGLVSYGEGRYSPISNVIFLDLVEPYLLSHEFMHKYGGIINNFTLYRILSSYWTELNEGLTEFYTQKTFDKIDYDFDGLDFAKHLDEASGRIKEVLQLKFDPLAKAFFIDFSLSNFEDYFDQVFGKNAFSQVMSHSTVEKSNIALGRLLSK